MAQRTNAMIWGTPTERERRRRIFLSVWAYADQFMNTKIVGEQEYDHESRMINLTIATGDNKWDAWWKENFKVGRTDWVRNHPHKRELHILAIQLVQNRGIWLPNQNKISQLPKTQVEPCDVEDCNCQGTGHSNIIHQNTIGSDVLDITEDEDGDPKQSFSSSCESDDWCKISEPVKIVKEVFPQEEALVA